MAMICPKCYNQARDGAKFCSRCGTTFVSQAASELPPTAPINMEEIIGQPVVEMPGACSEDANSYAMDLYTGEGAFPIDKQHMEEAHGKARNIVKLFSAVAAGLTLMWLPFLDIFFLIPLLCFMVITIAKIFGQKLSFDMAKDLIVTCFAGSVGFLGAYLCGKFIPVVGGLLTAPVIFACTYGIGDVSIAYFSQEGKLSRDQMRDIYSKSFQNSKQYYSGDLGEAKDSLDKIKGYLSPEEYEKLKNRLS